jgi:hypothetical protein
MPEHMTRTGRMLAGYCNRHDAGQITAGVGAPVAEKADDPGFKRFIHGSISLRLAVVASVLHFIGCRDGVG